MIALKNILVATDFSEASEVAVTYGRVLADAFGSRLHLIHVVPEAMALPWAAVTDGTSLQEVQAQWERESATRLREELPVSLRDSDRVIFVTRAGDPVRQIVDYAKAEAIDLIVLGTHGRGFVAHVFLGSVAEHVVRRAPCPVLTVRHPQHGFLTEAQSVRTADAGGDPASKSAPA